ncbi:MAG: HAD family hydrolase, partial [Chloroflexota bacterium]|nr:HAD family hydrolase [Chloroflexota bacterium]
NDTLNRLGQPRKREELEAAYGCAVALFEQTWRAQKVFIASEGMELILKQLGIEPAAEVVEGLVAGLEGAILQSPPQLVEGAKETLHSLHRNGYLLGLISDTAFTPGRLMREVMRADGLLPLFDHLTFSDELGCTKPHPEAFLSTLRALGVEPEWAAHVGDLPETDIRGAKGVGMKAILFTAVSHRLDGADEADAVIGSFEELKKALVRLG